MKQAYLKASLNSPWRLLHNLHAYLNRMSFFDDFPALDIANILGHSNHVTWRMVCGVPMFYGDPLSIIIHVEDLFHVLQRRMWFMMMSICYCSWALSAVITHGCIITNQRAYHLLRSSLKAFLDIFTVCPALKIQEEAFIEHHNHLGKLEDEQERGSSLGPHDENRHDDNSKITCDRGWVCREWS